MRKINIALYRIKYFLYSFLYSLTKKEKFLKSKKKYENLCRFGTNLVQDNGLSNVYDIDKIKKYGISLKIEGNNNKIFLKDNAQIKNNLKIQIFGSNNEINLGNIIIGRNLDILMAYPPLETNGSKIIIGDTSRFVDVRIMLLENNSKCKIGEDCMFSENVFLHLSDTHSIFDLDGNLINYGGDVEIKDRVWVGRDALILKNAKLEHDTIVGARAVVSKKFDESNIIIAGNPSKIIKRGTKWSTEPPQKSKDKIDKEK